MTNASCKFEELSLADEVRDLLREMQLLAKKWEKKWRELSRAETRGRVTGLLQGDQKGTEHWRSSIVEIKQSIRKVDKDLESTVQSCLVGYKAPTV